MTDRKTGVTVYPRMELSSYDIRIVGRHSRAVARPVVVCHLRSARACSKIHRTTGSSARLAPVPSLDRSAGDSRTSIGGSLDS